MQEKTNPAGDSCPIPEIRQITAQLERILASQLFHTAPVLSRLLRYLVEKSMADDANDLKEYSVGMAVFQRGASFDPATDTIVRAQARRLRSRLDAYYENSGRTDSIRIVVPKGHYVVEFHAGPPEPRAASDSGLEYDWLPVPPTRLIGRARAVEDVGELLLSDSGRLLTLTGAGGSGKTRLAIEAASRCGPHFPGGVAMAALAPVAEAERVIFALAQAFRFRHTGDQSMLEALRDHLHFVLRAPALLLVDNFEHVLAAGPELVRLLEASPFLRILVTSRAVLHVYGEREYPVPPLEGLDPGALPPLPVVAANPAVALFVERAQAVDPRFRLAAGNAGDVARVCSRLDGLPLAIELAAARTRTMPPAAMLERMEGSLDLLTAGPAGVPARQQTLRKTIDWSYRLLDAAQQRLFRRLSVFAGGCTAEGAEAVADSRSDLGMDVSAGLSGLAANSLLESGDGAGGEVRFRMLETIREYARERLAEAGETAAVRRAHAAYCLVIAEEGGAARGAEESEMWLRLCDREHANLQVGFDFLVMAGEGAWALRMANALYRFWESREHLAEGLTSLESAIRLNLEEPVSTALASAHNRFATLNRVDLRCAVDNFQRAKDIFQDLGDDFGAAIQVDMIASSYLNHGDLATARPIYEDCVATYQALGRRVEAATAMSNLARAMSGLGEWERARSLVQAAMPLFAEGGQAASVAWALNHLGDLAVEAGDAAGARDYYLQALERFRQLGELEGVGRTFLDLGYLAMDQGEPGEAQGCLIEAGEAFRRAQQKRGVVKVIEAAGALAALKGESERVLMLLGAAAVARRGMLFRARHHEQTRMDGNMQVARSGCDASKAAAAEATGSRLGLQGALELALTGR